MRSYIVGDIDSCCYNLSYSPTAMFHILLSITTTEYLAYSNQ